jgi:hypothetical protein
MECWSVGVLECWSVGVLEYWSTARSPNCTRVAGSDAEGATEMLFGICVWYVGENRLRILLLLTPGPRAPYSFLNPLPF